MNEISSRIFQQFDIPGAYAGCERFGSGLINDTWLLRMVHEGLERRYIIQRVNTSVFTEPIRVMENIETVTTHIASRLWREGIQDPFSITPALVRTKKGASYFIDEEGGFWRAFHFIEFCTVYDRVDEPALAHEVGAALGRFHTLVSDLPPHSLHDTLPGFHHTPRYLRGFDEAVKADAELRASGAAREIDFVNGRRRLAPILVDAVDSGRIPLRVVHNDPKVNNVLIHSLTRKAVGMIDLDTVKPGIVHFDFGDCARSVANLGGEDAEDLATVTFDLNFFEALVRGYMSEAGAFLTPDEIALLPESVKVITFELGLRFLADYLRGDVYFKINYPSHNLHRARVQFSLLECIEKNEEKIKAVISSMRRQDV